MSLILVTVFYHYYTRDDQVEEISWGDVEQLGTLVR